MVPVSSHKGHKVNSHWTSQEFHTFYITKRYITVFTTDHSLSLTLYPITPPSLDVIARLGCSLILYAPCSDSQVPLFLGEYLQRRWNGATESFSYICICTHTRTLMVNTNSVYLSLMDCLSCDITCIVTPVLCICVDKVTCFTKGNHQLTVL